MECISISKKVRSVLFLAIFAVSAFANADNFNFYGQLGFHKTQSAKTLGHGRFGIGAFIEGTGLNPLVGNGGLLCVSPTPDYLMDIDMCPDNRKVSLGDSYIGINGYPFISLGLSDYFDFGISLPMYYERIGINQSEPCLIGDCADNINAGGQGDLQILAKIRIPLGDDIPVDIAAFFGGSMGVGRTSYHGLWVRDPSLLNVKTENRPIAPGASTYTNTMSTLKFGGAVTFDLNKLQAQVPLLFHFNYMYRQALGEDGSNYPVVQTVSTAVEWTPSRFISLLGEFYMDMPNNLPVFKSTEAEVNTSTFTFGSTFHFSKYVDLQMGVQMLLGDEDKYVRNLTVPMNNLTYDAALIPKYLAFGGLNFKIFTIEPPEEYEAYRNPDTDGDGVCDPWVAREGRQHEFAHICTGIDLCPYEPGPLENNGCPVEEIVADLPTVIFNTDQASISSGQFITLSWVVTNANEVSIEGIGDVSLQGSRRVKPSETTAYTLTATGDGGVRRETLEIIVESAPGPVIVFSASPEAVQMGQSVTLTWMVTEATEVEIEGIGKVATQGTRRVRVSDAGISAFTLIATGPGGTKTESVEVEVLSGPPPVVIFTASSESIQAGQTVTLNWQVTNATEIEIDNDIGKVPARGTKRVKLDESTVFKLTATGEGGTEIAIVQVEVEEPPPAPVIEARVNLQGVTFGSGNATLTPNAMKVLDGVVEQLLAYPQVKIEIQGHTDNVGNPRANQELSERRARAVVGYLARQGVSMSRMSAVGFGQDIPIEDNKTAAGREQNRRIEMIRVDE
ncbi:MAG: OmpA family protein [Fibromonadaceae bacterium]|jgi:outer membrane protein OmpA-like peptidoglycan-associated protein|nr:OmpA family protein [Fibromonadaceae bacterium]